MSEEDILRNTLNRIHENSTYGLNAADQAYIATIMHNYIERIKMDIGNGYDRLNCPKPPIYIGPVVVKTLRDRIIEEAAKELQNEADKLILQKEENKMKATSVQNIKNVNNICFSIENNTAERESKLTIVASTNDDIFEFGFEGPELLQICKGAGLFTGWEKDQKIRGLEEKIKQLERDNAFDKETADYWSNEYDTLSETLAKLQIEKDQKIREKDKEIDKLKQQLPQVEEDKERLADMYKALEKQYNLEKAANEAHHKFFRQYVGKGLGIGFYYAMDNGDEVSYVIVDKEEYEALKNCDCRVRLHGMDFTRDELINRILELEKLKTPTIENFADEEPTDNVNHPSHYETGKFECIEVMQEVFGTAAVMSFCKCNAFKYIYRMDRKNGDEDVRKAIWYLNKYLELTKKEEDGGADNGGKTQISKG